MCTFSAPVFKQRVTMPRATVNDDEVEHLSACMHLHLPRFDLASQRLMGTNQELLPRLPLCVKGSGAWAPPKDRLSRSPP